MSEDFEFGNDDERLSAYLDGALPEAQRAELERRLQQEPALAARLAQLERADTAVRNAYGPVIDEPLPQGAIDLLGATDGDAKESPSVVELSTRRKHQARVAPTWPLALAASFMLAIGIGFGYLIAESSGDSELEWVAKAGVIEPGSALHVALESDASGSIREIGNDQRVMPILSFVARDGEVCRQVEVGGAETSAEALACRRNGSWRLDALGLLPDRPFGGNLGGFRPAGAAGSAIDALIDQRIVGDPLDPASEQALIDNDWAR